VSLAKLQGGASGTGSVTLLAPNTNNTDVLTLPDVAADTLVGAAATQTLTNKTLGSGLVAGASYLTSGTAVASTSGTNIDFTSIPSWVKRITVMFNGVSISSTAPYSIVQLGSGSVTASGYLGTLTTLVATSTISTVATTTGFYFGNFSSTADTVNGQMVLTLQNSNNWVASGTFSNTNNLRGVFTAGNLSLGGTLDRIRITTTNGTTTFSAGSINILWE
jgi:hypothetical protein